MQHKPERKPLPAWQVLCLVVLTAVYLAFELAFNARLLDVVGGGANNDEIHSIEVYGRTLSGIALALFVLQGMLRRRANSDSGRPRVAAIVLACAASGGVVYVSIVHFVDWLAHRSSPAFRRASLNIALVQGALVRGGVQLDGLADDPKLFSEPAGKAFLALFPLMSLWVERLDDKIDHARMTLMQRQVSLRMGGASGFYDQYDKAVNEVMARWRVYRHVPTESDLRGEISRQQAKAWDDYTRDLARRHWTPDTVPFYARRAVVNKVRSSVPVPPGWRPNDQATFKQAVAARVRREATSPGGQQAITVRGQRVPAGLAWPAFFAQEGVQAELRDQLKLPRGLRLRHEYASGVNFDREVFRPMASDIARRELENYQAPADTFRDGGKNGQLGRDAARAVIVPPVALFFSLLGAVSHFSKLVYLLLSSAGRAPGMPARRISMGVPVGVALFLLVCFRSLDNDVTDSRLYGYLHEQIVSAQTHGAGEYAWNQALVHLLHVIAVGQSYGYPVNEFVRTRVLRGITYGYEPKP